MPQHRLEYGSTLERYGHRVPVEATVKSGQPRCQKMVHDEGRWPSYHQCTKAGIIREEDANWCLVHAPSTKQKKQAAEIEKYHAETAKFHRQHNAMAILSKVTNEQLEESRKHPDPLLWLVLQRDE